MTAYLFDTNHLGEVYKSNETLLQRLTEESAQEEITICTPSTEELWYMVMNSTKLSENTVTLVELLEKFVCWNFTKNAAEEFGRIKAELRRKGRPIPAVDIQIAAIARVNGLTVLTADAHFGYISDLRTENWLA